MELSGRVQELQNEANCMNDSKDFQESVRSGNSHDTSQPMSFPTHPIREGNLRYAREAHRGSETIMDLSGRLQELQNEVNLMNDSKDFQDAESVRSGNSHVTSQLGLCPKHPPF